MSLIAVEDLSLHFGPKKIFDGDNIAVETGDRLGIVGPNGAGKSTLLRLLAGEAQPDGGRINRMKGLRVGYLAQEHGSTTDDGLLTSVLATAPGKDALEENLAQVEADLASTSDTEAQLQLSERLADLHEELAELEQRFGPHRAEAILFGLGFEQKDMDRPLSALSGGWRMRAALASLLYQQPDVLLLDEPTNHLDLPSVHWLSGFLKNVKHAVVLTCHDREFLNRHVNRVASLELEGLSTFRGNYDAYLKQRTIELEHLEARIEKQAEKKKHLDAFVTRFKAKASKARQAQSRVKQLEKLEAEQEELPQIRRAMHVSFEPVEKSADRVLRIEDLSFAYPGKRIFSDVSLEVRRGDRIAIVGVNGAGKTTLLRLIASELEPDAGALEPGRHVQLSYFAQHHTEALNLGRTILDEVRAVVPEASETRVRSLCGAVLFGQDDVEKPVEVLSGGEKARVALARMLARPANLLLLDEPTNHLDTESADVLTESLEGFDGTMLFVSHNLGFAARLSNRVWDVSDGRVVDYPGTLSDYLDHVAQRQAELEATFASHGLEHARSPAATASKPTSENKAERIARREEEKKQAKARQRDQRKAEAEVARLEAEMEALETEKAALEGQLEDPATLGDPERLREVSERLGTVSEKLDAVLEAWTEAEALAETFREG